ncbi:hypothetical protein BGX21_008115 [Mortierella sp. AD011]|nr:hypothetical protein BGX20_008731 [Mortierella sp. AD010]KAF9402922.1 hypothetical protein BGX21_008115 [Mortierella sp. AD011]
MEFRRYLTSRNSSAGPDLIFNVSEYATFLPRPLGIKERPLEKSPSTGSNNWTVPPSPPRTASGYAAGFGPPVGPNFRSSKITYPQCAPPSPPELLRESTEMIAKLPVMMSPTIPEWAVPARPVTGGKQPGNIPAVPPDLGASSDESSSDSDRESDHQSSAADSEGAMMNETDTNPRYKSIGRKTAQRRNSKTGMIAGKRLTGYIPDKPNSSVGPSAEYCCMLSSEEMKELPHRSGKASLSESPAVVRINIPPFLLPEFETRLKSLSSTLASKSISTRSPSPPGSPKRKSKSEYKKYHPENETSRKSTKRSRAHSHDLDSDSNLDSERSDTYSRNRKKGDRHSKYETDKPRNMGPSLSPILDRKKQNNGRMTSTGDDNDSKQRDKVDSSSKSVGPIDKSTSARRRRSSSGSLSPENTNSKSHRKDLRDESRDGSARKRRPSKEDSSRRAGGSSHKDDQGRSTKHRSHGHSRSRSRSPSNSRPRRRSRDRDDDHDIKASRGRRDRDYDDDRSSSKTKRKRDTSREQYDKPAKGRRDKSRSRSVERDDSRERRRDKKRQRSRSQSRERSDARREKDKHRREPSSTKAMADVSEDTQTQKSPIPQRKNIESRRESSNVAQPPTETGKTGAASPSRTSSDAQPQKDSATTSAPTVKKFTMEDYQRRRLESDVGTPKATNDSPALSSSSAVLSSTTNDQGGTRKMATLTTESTSSGQSKYDREYRRYHTMAISLKRKADEISHVQRNPRLGAIVYFLSGNAFMRAFHFNDRHLEHIYSNRPELVLRESMKCWSSMKQFTTALSAQCCDKFPGLDGISYLLEALIYYKCHTYTNQRLRVEMQGSDQFKKRSSKDGSSSSDPVTITPGLATKLMQYAEDWANLSAKLEECQVALTPDIAREQFPETFKKWCIHPEDIGNSEGRTFSMTVEQKQKIVVGVVDGVVVHDEKVRTFPKIMWPLGTYMHLSNLMDFAEEALHEYQVRNSLEYNVTP